MKFQKMKGLQQGLKANLEKAPAQWKKESSFMVNAFLLKAYLPSMEWYQIQLLKGLWPVISSSIILNLLWYILWISCIKIGLTCYSKMPLCSPFPGYFSILVMDNAHIHYGDQILALADQFHLLLLLSCYQQWLIFYYRDLDRVSPPLFSRPQPDWGSFLESQGFYSMTPINTC